MMMMLHLDIYILDVINYVNLILSLIFFNETDDDE